MISFRSRVGRDRVGTGPVDTVRGSGPVDAVRFRFPPPTTLPCDDLELGGFFVALEGTFPVLERIFLVFERGIEVEWRRCEVGWKWDGKRHKRWERDLVMGRRPQGLK